MEIEQGAFQKAIQTAKGNPKTLDLSHSRSATDPPFSAEEWKILIPFITNNPNLEKLRLDCKLVIIHSNNLPRLYHGR